MTSPNDLRPAAVVPALDLLRVESTSPLVRTTEVEVGVPYAWRYASAPYAKWKSEMLAHPLRQYWLITHEGRTAGVAYLEPHPGGDVEITSFGLLPDFVGKGLGGYALTLALRQAWATKPVGADGVRRVWLHTSTQDHPNALPNYQKRGLRPFRSEVKPQSGEDRS